MIKYTVFVVTALKRGSTEQVNFLASSRLFDTPEKASEAIIAEIRKTCSKECYTDLEITENVRHNKGHFKVSYMNGPLISYDIYIKTIYL